MKATSRLARRRNSIIFTVSLFLILNSFIAYYVQSLWGLLITGVMMGAVEIIYLNAYASTWMPRIGRMPLHAGALLLSLIYIGRSLIISTSVFLTNTEVRLVVGWAILSGVAIMLIRWFHWHYHVVPLYLRLQARNMTRVLSQAETT